MIEYAIKYVVLSPLQLQLQLQLPTLYHYTAQIAGSRPSTPWSVVPITASVGWHHLALVRFDIDIFSRFLSRKSAPHGNEMMRCDTTAMTSRQERRMSNDKSIGCAVDSME